jgi:hypothetical protein
VSESDYAHTHALMCLRLAAECRKLAADAAASDLTEVLKRYGITDGSDLRVNTVKEGDSPLHLVGISAPGDLIRAIPSKRAIELSIELRQVGEDELAEQISTAAHKAQRANSANA